LLKMAQSIEVTGCQRVPLEAELMMDEAFYVNTTVPVVHNVVFDAKVADRQIENILVLDAEKELDILEESPFVSVTVFCMRWLQNAFNMRIKDDDRLGALKEVVVAAVESETAGKELLDFTEVHTDVSMLSTFEQGQETVIETKRRTKQRITKGNRSLFAARLANEAKLKFGTLKYTEANMLMVRRWLSKFLDVPEFKDLRITDKVLALDRAVFMAFVVSEDFQRFKVLFESKKMQDKVLLRFGATE